MARPQKEGMDYFPHDTDAVNDEKIEALRALYGNDGYAFYFILLERIYRTNNFELDVSDAETIQILARKVAVTTEKFKQMLDTALKWNCFDADAYKERGCLTSSGIKKRARVVVEKRKKMQKAYRRQKAGVSEAETGEETGQETEAETPQSKVKERKVKKSKTQESKAQESKASNNKNNMPPEGGGASKKRAQAGEKRIETPNGGGNAPNSGKNGDSRLTNDCRNDCQYDNKTENGITGGKAPGNGYRVGNAPADENWGDHVPDNCGKDDDAPVNGYRGKKVLENGNYYGDIPGSGNRSGNMLESSIRDGNASVNGKQGDNAPGSGITGDILPVNSNQGGNTLLNDNKGDNVPGYRSEDGNAPGNGNKGSDAVGSGKKDDRPRLIMDYYNQVFSGLWARPLRLTRERRAKIKARLRTFSVNELMAAISNIRQSAFHCGENDKGRVYATPEFIFRNDSQVDKWLKAVPQHPKRAGPEPKSWGVLREMWEEGDKLN